MNEPTYSAFLEGKIKDEHTYTHLLEEEVAALKDRVTKLLKDISALRKTENELRLRSRQAEEKVSELQMELRSAKDMRSAKFKEAGQRRVKEERQERNQADPKFIFRSYLDNTFPRNKGIIKKLLKVFFVLEQREDQQPLQKIKFYQALFEGFVKRVLDWIFPRKSQAEKSLTIAQNLLKEWKEKHQQDKKQMDSANILLFKQAEYVARIDKLEAENIILKANKSMVESRLKTFERALQIKGGEFVVHLKKMLTEDKDLQPESHNKVEEILQLFTRAVRLHESMKQESKEKEVAPQKTPLVLPDRQGGYKRKVVPVVKKNIYGYYPQPQLPDNFIVPAPTRHPDRNKHTQTLPEDLCVLTLHPVLLLTLIDANIKPQRNRHCTQFYVRIGASSEANVESTVREGFQLIWNEPFLLKDYDFPFLQVWLMHKSKGLRDSAIGGGKLMASKAEEQIVNIRREKQFQGRIRFALAYPNGNIYEFKITSVRLMIPAGKTVLKEEVTLKFPYNPQVFVEFVMPQQIVYMQRSIIILQTSEESMCVTLARAELNGGAALRQLVGKEGHREVLIELDEDWKVIIQAETYLLVCEDEEPQIISEELLEAGKGKYFSVRAPPPIITVAYGDTLLHSHIKFPLVFSLQQDLSKLNIVKELPTREIIEEIVEPILNKDGQLKLSEFIKAPSKIYKFFIETLQGEEVRLKHESHLFERLLKEIHLQVSYKENQLQEVDYGRKGKDKGKQLPYKQFTIQSKELMLNHFRVFNRHFKRIGFIKFKLGYTIYDNPLLTEANHLPIKDSRKLEPLSQGTYFIQLQLAQAHLPSKSPSSTYYCIVNGETSSQKKGNHPQWAENFILSFHYEQKFEVTLDYEVWEESTFNKNKIYDGKLLINQQTMRLGAAILNLDEAAGDCLHFSSISVPSSLIRLSISQIQGEIKEEADWIGKIDPYIILSSKNRQLIKTEYLNNCGSHPVWSINKDFIIGREGDGQAGEECLFECKLYDYDLVGKDDYLGEVKITAQLNNQLITTGQSELIYGNLVKDNSICGSLRLKGSFQNITQQTVRFPEEKKEKIGKGDSVHRFSIYRLTFNDWKQFKDDRGIITFRINDCVVGQKQFDFNESALSNLEFTHWVVKSQSIEVQVAREYKRFFKTFTQLLGNFTVSVAGKQVIVGKESITNGRKQEVGTCYWYSEPQDQIKYASYASFTSCRHQLTIRSDLHHELSISPSKHQPSFIFYQNKLSYYANANDKCVELDCREVAKDVFGLSLENSDHKGMLCYFIAAIDNRFEGRLEQRVERAKVGESREYKQIINLHWEPYAFEQASVYEFRLKFSGDQAITLRQELSQLYNDYVIMKPLSIPVIFDSSCIPNSVEIVNAKTKQEEAVVAVQQAAKIFVQNKGVLYYKLQDYNLKTVMELHFKYLLIRIMDQQSFKDCKNVKLVISSTLTLNTYSSQLMPQTNSFLFQDITLLIAEPPRSITTFFFEAEAIDEIKGSLIKFKFGFRLQSNKQQYRIADSHEYFIHALFSCLLIKRNYEATTRKDNTIYGMSFLELRQAEFEVNEDPSNRHIFLEVNLSNQYQRIYLQRLEGTNICRSELSSVFFIERSSIAEFSVVEEGVLSNSVIGEGSIAFSPSYAAKQHVSLQCEVRKQGKIIGRLNIQYANLKQIPFVDVNIFTYISRNDVAINAELQEFGPNKQKYQRMTLTSRGDVARLQSEDSFIITKDPREYEITVNERDSNKLLGQFKLCHELGALGDQVTVLQPLRTSINSLNGVLIIDYQNKKSNSITWEQQKERQTMLLDLSISNIILKKHTSRIGEKFAVRLQSTLRENKTNMQTVSKPTDETPVLFTIYDNQPCEIALLDKADLIGTCSIAPPYFDGEERVLIFSKDSRAVGICMLKANYIKQAETYHKMREISSMQAIDLMDTETFTKMTPYVEMEWMGKGRSYASELGLGKEKIYWRVCMLTSEALRLIVKDKDMFLDDLIGSAVLEAVQTQQSQEITHELALLSQDNAKGTNGTLRVTTSPITAKFTPEGISALQRKEAGCFMLRLGGLTSNRELLKEADSIEVRLLAGEEAIVLLKQYCDDIYFYLSSKDVEVQFDTYFTNLKKENIQLEVNLNQKGACIRSQKISSQKREGEVLFAIYNLIPLERHFCYVDRIYLWMYDQVPSNIQPYLSSHNHHQTLRIASIQKYLIVLQPQQLCSHIDIARPLTLILKQATETYLQFNIFLDNLQSNAAVASGAISNKKKDIGYYFASISRFASKGDQLQRRIHIGKSRRKWISVCICEAFLTKDLEFFSKMDPYCKLGLIGQEGWRRTSVQDNVGVHPIWNESFFVELQGGEEELGVMVMDEEVTVDRAVGEGKIAISELLHGENGVREVEVFYKGEQSSGRVRVQATLTSCYLIFRNLSAAAEEAQFFIIHEENKEGEKGVKIEVGLVYAIDPSKEIKIRLQSSIQSMSYVSLKEKKVEGIVFAEECGLLQYDLYE